MTREYWHERLKESMFALRAADYAGVISMKDYSAVAEFIEKELVYSCLREFLDSLPEDDPRRKDYLVLLPEKKRENPAQSKSLGKIL